MDPAASTDVKHTATTALERGLFDCRELGRFAEEVAHRHRLLEPVVSPNCELRRGLAVEAGVQGKSTWFQGIGIH